MPRAINPSMCGSWRQPSRRWRPLVPLVPLPTHLRLLPPVRPLAAAPGPSPGPQRCPLPRNRNPSPSQSPRPSPRRRPRNPGRPWAGPPGTPEGGAASAAPMFDAGSEQLAEANKRVQALEAEMAAFKKRDGVDRGQLAQLRAELDAMRQESGGSSWLFNALLLALIAAVAVIGWMAWRMRSGALLFSREPDALRG